MYNNESPQGYGYSVAPLAHGALAAITDPGFIPPNGAWQSLQTKYTISDLASDFGSGAEITADTDQNNGPHAATDQGLHLVTEHAYAVTGVTHDALGNLSGVQVTNPWGDAGSSATEVGANGIPYHPTIILTLTPAQFYSAFPQVVVSRR
jgi:hypothetical protein